MTISKAAIYCRLSKEDADKISAGDYSESIRNQKLLLTDYAACHGFCVIKTYVDDDYSGLDKNRPQFQQMIRDAERGLFEVILCKNQSRFTRDMELVEKYLHGLFVLWGVRFIGVADNVDTNVKGNKKARQINGLVNEWYCEDLSESIKAVFRKKMEDGQFLGPFACYGYAKDPRNKHLIVVDEEASEVVKKIFSLYISGYGSAKIAQILTAEGIPTPTHYKKSKGLNYSNPNGERGGKHGAWSANTVKRILGNEAYIGTMIQGRERKESYKSSKVTLAPRCDWVIKKNNHKPIIDERTFYTVQNLIKSRRTQGNINCGTQKRAHILAGKVKCLDCGGSMQRSGATRDRQSHYLRCAAAGKTQGIKCTPHYIRQDNIERLIERKIREIIELAIQKCGVAITERYLREVDNRKTDSAKKKKQLADVDSRLEGYAKAAAAAYVDKVSGIISENEFISLRDAFLKEKTACEKRKSALEKELAECERDFRAQVDFSTYRLLTHEVINDFVDYVQIGERNKQSNEQEVVIGWAF